MNLDRYTLAELDEIRMTALSVADNPSEHTPAELKRAKAKLAAIKRELSLRDCTRTPEQIAEDIANLPF